MIEKYSVLYTCNMCYIVYLKFENKYNFRLHLKYLFLLQFYPEGTILSTGLSKWASAGGWRVS